MKEPVRRAMEAVLLHRYDTPERVHSIGGEALHPPKAWRIDYRARQSDCPWVALCYLTSEALAQVERILELPGDMLHLELAALGPTERFLRGLVELRLEGKL